eukprot:c21555_g1_i1.p1 GENE.c21555_g1_i1~~c21555_g1_i1.p1  ORF type:complete len:195 (+),score=31.67 c21555_g1_i1:143-727(+)
MLFESAVAVALLAASVSSQTSNANSTIAAGTIDLTLRTQWCNSQLNVCGTLCSGSVASNTCDENTLSFDCTCSANNSAPALVYYTGTMPTFICEEIFSECNKNNTGGSKAISDKCAADEKANCGHLDPTDFEAVATTTSSSASNAKTTSAGTSATDSASTSSSSAAAATMMAAGAQYGGGLLVAGAAAAFGLLI